MKVTPGKPLSMLFMDISHDMANANMSLTNYTEPAVYTTLEDMPIYQMHEFRAGVELVKYILITLVIVGTVGNGLSILVLIRRRMLSKSVNFYLVCLAFADTAVLYLSGFKTWLKVVTGIELLHLSSASCKIITFLFMTVLHASAWFVVLLTADRFIAVWFPFKATSLCTQKRCRIASAVMVAIVVLYNIHLLWTMELFVVPPSNRMIQCAGAHGNTFMNGPYEIMKLVSYAAIPFIFVLLMNIGIIIRICQHAAPPISMRHRFDARTNKRLLQSRQQLTVMLLVVSFAWLALSMPFPLIAIFPVSTPDNKARAKQFLAKTVCFLLMYLNHSINFFLYCIAGKRFRHELMSLLWESFATCQRLEHRVSLSLASAKPRSKRTKCTPPDME